MADMNHKDFMSVIVLYFPYSVYTEFDPFMTHFAFQPSPAPGERNTNQKLFLCIYYSWMKNGL